MEINDLSTLEDDKSSPSLFLPCICLRRKVWALQSICGRGLWWWEHIVQKTFDSVLKTAGKGAIGKVDTGNVAYYKCSSLGARADGMNSWEPKMFKLHRSLNRIHWTSSQSEFHNCLSLRICLSWKRRVSSIWQHANSRIVNQTSLLFNLFKENIRF